MAECKSCGAEIEWARTSAGRFIPLDVTRDGRGNQIETPRGNLVCVAGVVRYYTADDQRLARDRRVSHFATCINATVHRSER